MSCPDCPHYCDCGHDFNDHSQKPSGVGVPRSCDRCNCACYVERETPEEGAADDLYINTTGKDH